MFVNVSKPAFAKMVLSRRLAVCAVSLLGEQTLGRIISDVDFGKRAPKA